MLNQVFQGDDLVLTLQADSLIFQASLERTEAGEAVSTFRNGSLLTSYSYRRHPGGRQARP